MFKDDAGLREISEYSRAFEQDDKNWQGSISGLITKVFEPLCPNNVNRRFSLIEKCKSVILFNIPVRV